MKVNADDVGLQMPQPCDEWADLRSAAVSAGRRAARALAIRRSMWQLGRTGEVSVRVEPGDSPFAVWLSRCDHAVPTEIGAGVSVPIEVAAEELFPATDAARKADALLVRHAYASAYCEVLSDEAGVTSEICISTIQHHPARSARSMPEEDHDNRDNIAAGDRRASVAR